MAHSINYRSTLLPLALAAALVTGGASVAGAQTTSPALASNATKSQWQPADEP